MDLTDLTRARDDIKFRGTKGTTGTQASFLALFNRDHAKVQALDEFVTKRAGFEKSYDVCSQTYSRKVDARIANAYSSFGATCQRIGGDIRHLAAFKEIEEPFESGQVCCVPLPLRFPGLTSVQIGSSAMAYVSTLLDC